MRSASARLANWLASPGPSGRRAAGAALHHGDAAALQFGVGLGHHLVQARGLHHREALQAQGREPFPSRSLWDRTLDTSRAIPEAEVQYVNTSEFETETLRVAEREVRLPGSDLLWRFQVAQDRVDLDKQINELPLNGRHFLHLGTLVANVNSTPSLKSGAEGGARNGPFAVGGARDRSLTFLVDGVDSTESLSGRLRYQRAAAYQRACSVAARWPTNCTRSARPSDLARASSSARRLPSLATTSRPCSPATAANCASTRSGR